MDELTIQLVRVLQGDEGDEALLERVDALLPEVRVALRAADDSETLEEVATLLEKAGQNEPDDERATAALRAAAEVAASDLGDWQRAADLYELALQRRALDRAALDRLEVLLDEHGEDARREAALMSFGRALDAAEADGAERAATYRRLGRLRAERLLDVDTAIAAYSAAVEAEPTASVMAELAELFQRRADLGDDAEAANLLCRLGRISEDDQAQAHLRQALDLVPDHQEALELLESRVPPEKRVSVLRDIYETFVAVAPEGPKVASVRAALEAAASVGQAEHEPEPEPQAEAESQLAPTVQPRSPSSPPVNSLSPLELSDDAPVSHRLLPPGRRAAALAALAAVATGILLFVAFSGESEQNAAEQAAATAEQAAAATEQAAATAEQAAATAGQAAATAEQGAAAEPPTVEAPATEPTLATLAAAAATSPSHATVRSAGADPLTVELVDALTRTAGGEIDRAALMTSIRAALPALGQCYANARHRLPKLQGRLVFSWTIDVAGRAKLAKLMRGTIADKPMRRCVGARLRAIRYPAPSGRPVRVTAPFVFSSQ